eukprot:CAMPEP_0183332712 /NCGR_PEP_ID=MMETSP0164_2-20130417/1807_1 /TAXON_ID=221442 /ORGANISM="Coccolithus pelagicus ssp braarudi, Strain PLY182g" /LENGTH=82 /DNA_ID=CAMNT_0025501489 /DNA_START=113 /DNA_END=361 /DNA_ORIENTATION=+
MGKSAKVSRFGMTGYEKQKKLSKNASGPIAGKSKPADAQKSKVAIAKTQARQALSKAGAKSATSKGAGKGAGRKGDGKGGAK